MPTKKQSVATPFASEAVASVYASQPEPQRASLLALRALLFDLAGQLDPVGQVDESLKWGSPSYVSTTPRVGTPIRLDRVTNSDVDVGVFVHCQSRVVEHFRLVHADTYRLDGTRGLLLNAHEDLPKDAVVDFMSLVLTYHTRAAS